MISEEEARDLLRTEFNVSRETEDQLTRFARLLESESERQNLVARPTLNVIWSRHILDSAQLLRFAPSPHASWIDLGSGAGFPGLIIGLLHYGRVTLVEERRLRVDFLARAAELLGLSERIEIVGRKVQRVEPRAFDVISARAFAPLEKLLALGAPFSTTKTRWVLPKGRNAYSELAAAGSSWQGDFRLEPSLTDPTASIIVAEKVQGRAKGKMSP